MTPILCIAFAATAGKGALLTILAIASAAALFGAVNTTPHPNPLVPASSPDVTTLLGETVNIRAQFEVLAGTTDVIQGGGGALTALNGITAVPVSGTSFLESPGNDLTTLATPVAGDPAAGGNDGLRILLVDNGGHAHTVTTAAGKIIPGHNVITFNGTRGSWVELIARNGVWLPLGNSGVVIS
jgi:hypothetical protein